MKFQMKLLKGDYYFMWAKRMKIVLMKNQYRNIIPGRKPVPPDNSSQEDKLAYLEKSQSSSTTIVLSIKDNCMRTDIDTENHRVLLGDLKDK